MEQNYNLGGIFIVISFKSVAITMFCNNIYDHKTITDDFFWDIYNAIKQKLNYIIDYKLKIFIFHLLSESKFQQCTKTDCKKEIKIQNCKSLNFFIE
jgi:hypothetical protein